jgi:putative spermidine/putrescine transport system substrate-binding protein
MICRTAAPLRKSLAAFLALSTMAVAASPALAQEVTVSMVGGTYGDVVEASIVKPLEAAKLKVTSAIEPHPVRLTKLVTEKGQPGSYDVVQFPDYFMYQANSYGLLQDIDTSRITAWKRIEPAFRSPYDVPHIFSAAVIVYDPARVSPTPTSFAVFWDPKYKGRVGALDFMFPQWLWMASTQAGNATNQDFDKGWE